MSATADEAARTEAQDPRDAVRPGDEADAAPRPPRATPLLPEAGAAGLPLTIVVAILAFMASVALIGNVAVSRAVTAWTADLTGAVTVQVKGEDSVAIAEETDRAAAVLRDRRGVASVRRLTRAEAEELLAPWFGTGLPADVPVPGLVTATVTAEARGDLDALRADLAAAAPSAVLDDHGGFNDRLVAAGGRLKGLAFTIFAVTMLAAAAVIVFAARAGLAANKPIIEVLHLVGASDGFIAREVQRRYLLLGLRGGLIGALLAVVVVSLIAAGSSRIARDEAAFLPGLTVEPVALLWLLVIPLILCAVAAVAARLTVLRSLRRAA